MKPIRLRFRSDQRFRIVQLTDLHLRGDGGRSDARTQALVAAVLAAERPELAVLTGDVVDGETARDPGAALLAALAPLEAARVPFVLLLGNHDDEGPSDRAALWALAHRRPGLLRPRAPRGLPGVGNGVVEIAPARGRGVAARLYFFDSHAYTPTGAGTYAWVRHEQVAWYRAQARRAAAGCALAFLHIPLPEFAEQAWSLRLAGRRREPVCAPVINSGLFAAFHEAGEVAGVFAGHDHLNDFVSLLFGVRLACGRATGYGGYGRRDLPRGARVVELREGQPGFATWLRTAVPRGGTRAGRRLAS